jgi:Heavy-metal resistance protein CzcE
MKILAIAALLAGGVAAATPSFALTKADVIGEPGNPATADRTLHVTSDTRYLNVQSGETVNLYVNGQRLTWNFDGLGSVVNLQDIAGEAPDVDVYVSEPNDN